MKKNDAKQPKLGQSISEGFESNGFANPSANSHNIPKTEPKNLMAFSIVLPVYNEADSIEKTLYELRDVVSDLQHEIIVVDDGSFDGTSELIKQHPVTLIQHPYNRGYGAALKTGMNHAHYDLICIMDADGTYPSEQIPVLIRTLEKNNFDMVVGARTGKNVRIPFLRIPAKWFITKLANYLCGIKIPDLNSGLRVMKKDIMEEFTRILPDGFSFTSTITLAMLTNGYSVKYVTIDYFNRIGKSKIKPIKDTLNFIQLIIRTALYFNPLRVFVPASIFLVIFAFVVLIGSWIFLEKAMDVTFGVILMTAVMVMTIGMLADLINKKIK